MDRNQQTVCVSYDGKVKDPNKSYVEVLENIESWRIRNTKDKITQYVMDG